MRTVLLLSLAAAVCSVQGIRFVLDENVSLIEKMDPTSCPKGARYCAPNKCLRDEFWCDGEDDCDDSSDESNCSKCNRNGFRCDNKCIPGVYRCDGTKDCVDGADEAGCGVIAPNELFSCDNGTTRKLAARCDGHVHCVDQSDEDECLPNMCIGGSLWCRTRAEDGTKDFVCLPPSVLCDGAVYCDYRRDEKNCTFKLERSVIRKPVTSTISNSTVVRIVLDENVSPIGQLDPATCPSGTRYCPDNRCLKDEFWCDGNVDCKDALDEKNCSQCSPNAVICDGECKSEALRCDGHLDCRDGADEFDCGVIDESDLQRFWGQVQRRKQVLCDGHVHVANSGADESFCKEDDCQGGAHYCERADTGKPACVAKAHLCDGYEICDDGSDERNCTFKVDEVRIPKVRAPRNKTSLVFVLDENESFLEHLDQQSCPTGMRYCPYDKCIKDEFWCDGHKDCQENADEKDCKECSPHAFRCDGSKCVRNVYRCDGTADCKDGTDEAGCGVIPESDLYKCARGNMTRRNVTMCDGRDDCGDFPDDESECTAKMCQSGSFFCKMAFVGLSRCWGPHSVCDGNKLCVDGSDEQNCPFEVEHITIAKTTTTTSTASPLGVQRGECAPGSRWCRTKGIGRCLRDEHWCDGVADCDGPIDEVNCTTCSQLGWSCGDGSCVRKEYRCDGNSEDCEEEEDEQNCPSGSRFTSDEYFDCDDGDTRRHKSVRCDGQVDCMDESDERRCKKGCQNGGLFCDGHCIQASKVCDGKDDCYDGRDEKFCTAPGMIAFPLKPSQ